MLAVPTLPRLARAGAVLRVAVWLVASLAVLPPLSGRASAADDGTVSFVVELAVRPDAVDTFLDLLTPVLDAMRHEPTFVNAVLHRDPEDPARFMIYETWRDLDDVVRVQMHRSYRKAYWERLPDLLRTERTVSVWRPLRADFRSPVVQRSDDEDRQQDQEHHHADGRPG